MNGETERVETPSVDTTDSGNNAVPREYHSTEGSFEGTETTSVIDAPVSDSADVFVITVYDKEEVMGFTREVATHSAVAAAESGGGLLLYDPAGSFIPAEGGMGTGRFVNASSLEAYKRFHESRGSRVTIQRLEVTKASRDQIISKIEAQGDVAPFFCAEAVSYVLDGVCEISVEKTAGLLRLPSSVRDVTERSPCLKTNIEPSQSLILP